MGICRTSRAGSGCPFTRRRPTARSTRLIDAVDAVARHGERWAADYVYSPHTNEFSHRDAPEIDEVAIQRWFSVEAPAGSVV